MICDPELWAMCDTMMCLCDCLNGAGPALCDLFENFVDMRCGH